MPLTCQDPIFSITIKWPTLLLCKDRNAIYHAYKCNKCKVVQGRKNGVGALTNDCKRHLFSCYQAKRKKNLEDNKEKTLKTCCFDAPGLSLHLLNCHTEFKNRKEIVLDECFM